MKEKANNITEGSISRGILGMAFPLMMGFLLQNVFNIVDMYFVGWLGKEALAAVSLGGIFMGVIYTFALGISVGTIAVVARLEGMNDREGARRTAKQAIFLGIFLYAFVAVAANLAVNPILRLLEVQEEILPLVVDYTRILLTGSFVIFIPMAISAYLRGCGDTVTPMRGMMIASVANVLLDPIMIFGWLGFPKMGVAGSALATAIARGLGMVYFLWFISREDKEFHVPLLPLEIDFRTIWRIFRIGIFGSLQSVLRNMSEIVMMKLIITYGSAVTAAYGVGLRLRLVVLMPILGLATAASTMVGQNLGAGKVDRAEKSGWYTAGYSSIFMAMAAVILCVFAEKIMGIFNSNPDVIRDGALFIRYYAPSFVFIGLSISMEKALGGAGDTMSPMFITMMGLYLLRIPMAFYLKQSYGMEGVWMGIAFSSVITGIVFALWFWVGKWKKKKV